MKIKKTYLLLIAFTTINLQLITHVSQAQIGFDPAVSFPAGNYPTSVTSADFNGDSKADLAITRNDGSVKILLGNGFGSFGTSDSVIVGTGPCSIISADFNGDGKTDLAVANSHSNNVSILLGNGTGGFGAATNFPVIGFPYSIISADFNGDGKADLAIANGYWYSNYVSVLLANDTSGFGAATNFVVGSNPCSVISADFNGDGKADLAIANMWSSNVSVLLGNGLGGFGAATAFGVENGPQSIISSDFNGDGKADLATADSSGQISILLGNGAGSFGSSINFVIGNYPSSITTADFNGDGKADLAVTKYYGNNVSVLVGDGAGNFSSESNFLVGAIPCSVISADFNGDGKPDLVTANKYSNNVSILLNNPFGVIPQSPPICLVTVDSSLTHNVVVWEKINLDMTALDSFLVYREISTNNYQRIGVVLYDSISTFDDLAANPSATGYRYKLKSKSSHGIESLLFSNYHNTMYLTHAGADFSWTPYQIENNITPVSNYIIYRDNNSTGNFQSIGNTTGNQLGYTDVNYSSFPNASYYVEAVMTSGPCHPTRSGYAASRSNVKHIGINGVQQLNNLSTITIYPNPATNTITITGISGKTLLRLYDVVGKLIIEKEVENNTYIDASLFAEGSYTLFTSSKFGETYNKVVISR